MTSIILGIYADAFMFLEMFIKYCDFYEKSRTLQIVQNSYQSCDVNMYNLKT